MEPGEYDLIAKVEQRHWWYQGMRAIGEAIIDSGLPPASTALHRHPLQVLDAGCGTGGAFQWLARYGRVAGLDFHPKAIQYAARLSRRLCQASVMAVPFQSGSFDLVISQEVLYHRAVTDDALTLREFARVLRPGGWLFVRVPAHDWLRGAHDAQVHTRHRYAAQELSHLITNAGLSLQRLTSAAVVFLVAAVLRRWLQPRHAPPHSDVALPAAPVNSLLAAVLRAEARWLRRHDLPFGLQLIALARKPV